MLDVLLEAVPAFSEVFDGVADAVASVEVEARRSAAGGSSTGASRPRQDGEALMLVSGWP